MTVVWVIPDKETFACNVARETCEGLSIDQMDRGGRFDPGPVQWMILPLLVFALFVEKGD